MTTWRNRYRYGWDCTCTYGQHDDGTSYRIACDPCKKKEFNEFQGYCRCGQVVSNAAFFKKSSPHFNGTCRRWGEPRAYVVPEQSWKKPLPYPMPPEPQYSRDQYGEDMAAFCKLWGVRQLGDGYPEITLGFKNGWGRRRNARWIETYGGQCVACGARIEKGKRALFDRNTRQLLCPGEHCGQKAERERHKRDEVRRTRRVPANATA